LGLLIGCFWNWPSKGVVRYVYGAEYGRMVYICDSAMRSHFIAKNSLLMDRDEQSLSNLKAAEVGLLDCQKYDQLRKKMLFLGLSEDDLSYLALKYIENNSTDLLDIVPTHEIISGS
jgi:hypothetical protein